MDALQQWTRHVSTCHIAHQHIQKLTKDTDNLGQGGWTEAHAQAQRFVARLTLEGKATLTMGSSTNKGCSGFIPALPSQNFPGICLNDAESGVRTGDLVSGYPAQIAIGASWNRSLALERARYIGREFRAKGVNVALGPVIGPLGRVAKGGRNWEGFTNDPYLAGELVYPTIQGFQESVIACVKHIVANEQETARNPFFLGFVPGLGTQSLSSNLNDQTMHELYLWPFYDAMRAEPGSVMCAYNRVNGSHACQNSKVLNGLLKEELGFQGFVVSDWYGSHTGIAANMAGLDLVMPSSQFLSPGTLAEAVNNGSLPEVRLDDQAIRILAPWFRYAQLEDPGMENHAEVDARDPAGRSIRLQCAIEGHVLVKNDNNALPLTKPPRLSLFGYDAIFTKNSSSDPLTDYGMASAQRYESGWPFTILDELLNMASITDGSRPHPQIGLDGTLITGGGSGAITPGSATSPYDAFLAQAARDNTTLSTDFTSALPTVDAEFANDPCIVFLNAVSAESWDRSELQNEYSDSIVSHVADQCSNTIVVLHNAGIRLVDAWIEHPNITAVIFAHLPGEEAGNALVEIMYGKQSPSGRLPYTVARQESDYGALLGPDMDKPYGDAYPQSDFEEGLFIDYKHFVREGIAPRFPFGFGLTYSTFSYSSFQASWVQSADTSPLPPDASTRPIPQGGHASLWDIIGTASVVITNTGPATAAEVPQLYVGIAGSEVPRVLRGFEKILLEPGQSGTVGFELRRRDLSVWDVESQQWTLARGTHTLMVGRDVEAILYNATLVL